MQVIYIAITLILVLISEAVIDNFKGLFVSVILTFINCAAIQVVYMMYNYLVQENFSYILLIVLFLLILFIFLYYTYNLFRQVNNIIVKNEYLKGKKQYKV